jgi:hypothetical protein
VAVKSLRKLPDHEQRMAIIKKVRSPWLSIP